MLGGKVTGLESWYDAPKEAMDATLNLPLT